MATLTLLPILPLPPFSASPSLSKRRHRLEFALGRLTSIVTSCHAALKVHGSLISSDKGVLSVNQTCHHHYLEARPSLITEVQSLNLIADYYTDMVISGYWVGPDIDDGWGFVEAIINQVT